jgi:glutamyl-tRNA reductase
MGLIFLGSNFKTSKLAWLDQLQVVAPQVRKILETSSGPLQGFVVLATCNRFEIYAESTDYHASVEYLIKVVADELGVESDLVAMNSKTLYGKEVVEHLFSVASGLDSMIVGESEITGQVRRAFLLSQKTDSLGPELQVLFQTALQTSKKVSVRTGIGKSGKSVINTALEIANSVLGRSQREQALVIGTGAYARVVVKALKSEGVSEIFIYSRSGRAAQFAKSHDVKPVSPEQLAPLIASTELVVSASGTPGYSIDLELATAALEQRQIQTPVVLIDVALSRDVDPEVEKLNGYFVLNLEKLRELTPQEHSDAIEQAREIVLQEASRLELKQAVRSMDPAVVALRRHVDLWVSREIELVKRRVDLQTASQIERSLSRVANAILHVPTVKAREFAETGLQEDYLLAVKTLFDIEVEKNA